MKSLIILLLIGLTASMASAQDVSAGNFIKDNILKPLLQDLKNNSVSFIIQQLLGLIGKRQTNPAQDLIIDFSNKLSAIAQSFGNMFGPILENLKSNNSLDKLKAKIDFSKLVSDTQAAIKLETDNLVNKIVELFKKNFGESQANSEEFKQGLAQLMNIISSVAGPVQQVIQNAINQVLNLSKD